MAQAAGGWRERMAWDVEGGYSSPRCRTSQHPLRKHGGDLPTGEEATPPSWPWGQQAAAGSWGGAVRRGQCPSPPISFFFPKAILGNRPIQGPLEARGALCKAPSTREIEPEKYDPGDSVPGPRCALDSKVSGNKATETLHEAKHGRIEAPKEGSAPKLPIILTRLLFGACLPASHILYG